MKLWLRVYYIVTGISLITLFFSTTVYPFAGNSLWWITIGSLLGLVAIYFLVGINIINRNTFFNFSLASALGLVFYVSSMIVYSHSLPDGGGFGGFALIIVIAVPLLFVALSTGIAGLAVFIKENISPKTLVSPSVQITKTSWKTYQNILAFLVLAGVMAMVSWSAYLTYKTIMSSKNRQKEVQETKREIQEYSIGSLQNIFYIKPYIVVRGQDLERVEVFVLPPNKSDQVPKSAGNYQEKRKLGNAIEKYEINGKQTWVFEYPENFFDNISASAYNSYDKLIGQTSISYYVNDVNAGVFKTNDAQGLRDIEFSDMYFIENPKLITSYYGTVKRLRPDQNGCQQSNGENELLKKEILVGKNSKYCFTSFFDKREGGPYIQYEYFIIPSDISETSKNYDSYYFSIHTISSCDIYLNASNYSKCKNLFSNFDGNIIKQLKEKGLEVIEYNQENLKTR